MRSIASDVILLTETFAVEMIVDELYAAPIVTSSAAPGSTLADQLFASFQFDVLAPPSHRTAAKSARTSSDSDAPCCDDASFLFRRVFVRERRWSVDCSDESQEEMSTASLCLRD